MGKAKVLVPSGVAPESAPAFVPPPAAPVAKAKLVLVKAEYEASGFIASVAPNPKRPGTRCYGDYAAYQVGMPVLDYLTKAGIPRARASACLRWDLARGFITVSATAPEPTTQG